ncbi:ribokinase [Cytobacillus oceanisediminis]|jgi:ribokinase|uniref:Ribokinase n=1 Tax=Cytobacillus oceanisediminis TaxID=665099 RepID=A0A2V2ZYR4_9BACI|nr:ribokinase [Cytobacillus oceanisediminis]PWW29584.1 ribokinase [Cytobacillus oceanisediminis]
MITVLGSINMDLVTVTSKDPSLGETVLGKQFSTIPGGKGANQAVAAAKLGADVQMIGRVGDDLFGKEYLIHLRNLGISTENVKPVTHQKTGIASITVYEGDNKIIVVPGANLQVTPDVVEEYKDEILKSDWLLLQFEIPLESVEKALEIAHKGGVQVILNPAPFEHIPKHWFEMITYLTPNQYEAEQLFTLYKDDSDLLISLKEKLVITKGAQGVLLYDREREVSIPALKVEAVDTTGAGDTFNGALAVALSEGNDLKSACEFAVKSSALSVTKLGAQSGMPSREEVNRF